MNLRTHTGREINGPRGGMIVPGCDSEWSDGDVVWVWGGSLADHCEVLTKWGIRHREPEVKRPINYQGGGKIRTKRYGKLTRTRDHVWRR